MSNEAVAAVAMVSEPSTAMAPTAQQVQRFEQQLQVPAGDGAQYYGASNVEMPGVGSNWHVVMGDVGHLAQEYRAESAVLDASRLDSSRLGSAHSPSQMVEMISEQMSQQMSQLIHVSYTTMSISFVTTAERLAGENVRSLYQLS